MIPEVLLIADDLTGACDSAVAFANRGLRARVSFHPSAETEHFDVLAVSTESRDRELASFRNALTGLPHPSRFIFKKIDSTLRGNVGPEVSAAREAFGCELAVVTPAFPAMGRLVEAGWLRIDGDTGFTPLEVAAQFRGIEHCELRDAVCEADLDALVAEVVASGRKILWAGSGGLARAVAKVAGAGLARGGGSRRTQEPPVFCLGSHHPVTLEQERQLWQQRQARILRIPRDGVVSLPTTPSPLVLSGGDTASLICRQLRADAIDVMCEIAPGIPCGILAGGPFDGMPVVTKSGGFGSPNALIEISDYFTCSSLLH